MADEEFRVEVVLGNEEHGLTFWERFRTHDLDDDARKRLGSQVTVTRDGNRMLLYTHTLEDAQEAKRAAEALVADDNLTAEYTVTRWNPAEQDWTDPSVPVDPAAPPVPAIDYTDVDAVMAFCTEAFLVVQVPGAPLSTRWTR